MVGFGKMEQRNMVSKNIIPLFHNSIIPSSRKEIRYMILRIMII